MMVAHFSRYLWRYHMQKTLYGSLIVIGPIIAYVSSHYGRIAANASNLDPSLDWYYDLISYGSMAGILIGVVMFFAGALLFARTK